MSSASVSNENTKKIGKKNSRTFAGISIASLSIFASLGALCLYSLRTEEAPTDIEKLIHILGAQHRKAGSSIPTSHGESYSTDDFMKAKETLTKLGHQAMPYLLRKIEVNGSLGLPFSESALNNDFKSAGGGDFFRGMQVRLDDVAHYINGDTQALAPKWRGIEETLDVISDIAQSSKDTSALVPLKELWDTGQVHSWVTNPTIYWRNLAHALFNSGDRTHISEIVKAYKGEKNRFQYNKFEAYVELNNYACHDPSMTFDYFSGGSELKNYCIQTVANLSNKDGPTDEEKMTLSESKRLLKFFGEKSPKH